MPREAGLVWTFKAQTAPIRTAVFCPKAASSSGEVELLVFVHGIVTGCRPHATGPTDYIIKAPFNLGSIVAASNRPVVLAVPYNDWAKRKSHPLSRPGKLNRFVDEVMEEVGRVRGTAAPSLHTLILAGHSRAWGFLDSLARAAVTDGEMREGALAKLSQVWAFDTTYVWPPRDGYKAWLDLNRDVAFRFFYIGESPRSPTKTGGDALRPLAGEYKGRFSLVADFKTGAHCSMPRTLLPSLLRPSMPDGGTSSS